MKFGIHKTIKFQLELPKTMICQNVEQIVVDNQIN